MRYRLAGLALVLVLTRLAAAAPASPGGDFARIMHLLGAQQHRRAHFTLRQHLGILDRPQLASGELIYDAPDRLEERLLHPRRESVTIDAERMTVVRGRHRRVLDLAHAPQIALLIESIRATLAGDSAALSRAFAVDFSGDVAHWTLRLKPRSATLERRVALIRIDGEGDALRRVQIRQLNGDRSSMRIREEPR